MIMKLKKYIYGVALGVLSLTLASCYNADRDFPDYEGGTTAYFAYQFPVRTIILGNDIYDNTLDNEHKCRIWATMGGAYSGRNAVADFIIEESLCDNLWFLNEFGQPSELVTPMPRDYYDIIGGNIIPYNGDSRGYVEIQLKDKFFDDPKAIENTYVIPLRMTKVDGIDRLYTGTPLAGTPSRTDVDAWKDPAKDYVLYCVKYMNPWQARYIRRGIDKVTDNGVELAPDVRKDFSLVNTDLEHYTENPVNQNDEICGIATKNMTQCIFTPSFKTTGASVKCNLILTFDKNNKCTISTEDEGVTAEGEGEFIVKGTDRAEYKDYQWGSMNQQPVSRDILRLSYKVNFTDKNIQVETKDTMVVQTRESNKKEFFDRKYINE
jgi:hypothetical protein